MNVKALIPLVAVCLAVSYAAEFTSTEQSALPSDVIEAPSIGPIADGQTLAEFAIQQAAPLEQLTTEVVSGYNYAAYKDMYGKMISTRNLMSDAIMWSGHQDLERALGQREYPLNKPFEDLARDLGGDDTAVQSALKMARDRVAAIDVLMASYLKMVELLKCNPIRAVATQRSGYNGIDHFIACLQEDIDYNIGSARRETEAVVNILEQAAF